MEVINYFAHPSNYKKEVNKKEYIIFHYTGNINDTALANCKYYKGVNMGSSAHFFVDDNDIYCSVLPDFTAWSVGIGNRKQPYIRQPMYGVITNRNSISIEMCGSKNSRIASDKTIKNAIELCEMLMDGYNIPINNIYRHWDVTGKECPAWLVDDVKWNNFKNQIGGSKEMTYDDFKKYMDKYIEEIKEMPGGNWSKNYREYLAGYKIMENSMPKMYVTREELATVIWRIINQTN